MNAQVTDAAERRRFEIHQDGQLAGFLRYERRGPDLVLVHTEVDPAFGGQGLGGQLVRFAVEDAARTGRTVVAECEYARSWLARHPGSPGVGGRV